MFFKRLLVALAIILVGFGLNPPLATRSLLPTKSRVQLECPQNHIVRVGIDTMFDAHHQELIRDVLPNFRELGINAQVVDGVRDVTVDYWVNITSTGGQRCADTLLGFAPNN